MKRKTLSAILFFIFMGIWWMLPVLSEAQEENIFISSFPEGPALTAPRDVATDDDGNVYVVDWNVSGVKKIDPNGNLLFIFASPGSESLDRGTFNGITVNGEDIYLTDRGGDRILGFKTNGDYFGSWGSLGSGVGQFNDPWGIAVDSTGKVYVADSKNHRIQKFDPISEIWEVFAETTGTFNEPAGVAVDSADNIYVAGYRTNNIQKFDSAGVLQHVIGEEGSGVGQFKLPQGVDVDSSGNIYVSDTNNNRIQKFDAGGTHLLTFSATGIGDVAIQYPQGVHINGVDDVLVSDLNNHRVVKFTSSGLYQQKFGIWGIEAGHFNAPTDIAFDSLGNVYISDRENHRIQVFDPSGTFLRQWGSFGSGNGYFNKPWGITVDSTDADNVYVVDSKNHRIQKFTSEGMHLGTFGSVGSGAGQFNEPRGVATDENGDIYVAEYYHSRVQKFDSAFNWVATWYGPTGQELYRPQAILADNAGHIYVADTGNNKIKKFDLDGNFLLSWGSSGLLDGQFRSVRGLSQDSEGNIWAADQSNNRIQKFTPTGTFLEKMGSFRGSADGEFYYPYSVGVDGLGIYVVDTYNHRIQKFGAANPPLTCIGFESPFDVPLGLKKKSKRTIPLKLTLLDLHGNEMTDMDLESPPVVNVIFNSQVYGETPLDTDDLLPNGSANEDNIFRFDYASYRWIYNLGTKQFTAPGVYTVIPVAGDDTYEIGTTDECIQTFERLD